MLPPLLCPSTLSPPLPKGVLLIADESSSLMSSKAKDWVADTGACRGGPAGDFLTRRDFDVAVDAGDGDGLVAGFLALPGIVLVLGSPWSSPNSSQQLSPPLEPPPSSGTPKLIYGVDLHLLKEPQTNPTIPT